MHNRIYFQILVSVNKSKLNPIFLSNNELFFCFSNSTISDTFFAQKFNLNLITLILKISHTYTPQYSNPNPIIFELKRISKFPFFDSYNSVVLRVLNHKNNRNTRIYRSRVRINFFSLILS